MSCRGHNDAIAELVEQLQAKTVALRRLLERRPGQLEDHRVAHAGLRAQHRIEQLREGVVSGVAHALTAASVPRWSATPPWQSSTSPATTASSNSMLTSTGLAVDGPARGSVDSSTATHGHFEQLVGAGDADLVATLAGHAPSPIPRWLSTMWTSSQSMW